MDRGSRIGDVFTEGARPTGFWLSNDSDTREVTIMSGALIVRGRRDGECPETPVSVATRNEFFTEIAAEKSIESKVAVIEMRI